MIVKCNECSKPVDIGKAYYCPCKNCMTIVLCDDCTPIGAMLSTKPEIKEDVHLQKN